MSEFINLENVNILEALYNFAMAFATAVPWMAGWTELFLQKLQEIIDGIKNRTNS